LTNTSLVSGFSLLKLANVRRIFFAYIITYIGTAMAPIAMVFGVLELTGSPKDTAYVMAASTIATILILLIGGALADRYSRKMIILFSEVFAMVNQAVIAVLFLKGIATVEWLAFLMLFNGIAMGFNAPATTGLIVQVVDREQLQSLNALLGIAKNGAHVAGAALGGILVALIGVGWTFTIDAISFGVSAILFATLKLKPQIKGIRYSMIRELASGWHVFRSHKWIWVIVIQFAFVVSAYQAIIAVVGPAIAFEYYQGSQSWGWIMAGFGAGLFVGGFIGMKINPKYPLRLATICVFSASFNPLSLSVPLPVLLTILLAFLNGILWEIFGIIWVSTLQKRIAPDMLSRVSAYDYIGSIGLAPIGIILSGIFFESLGFRVVTLVSAAIIVFATLCALMVKDVWYMERD